MGAAAIGLLVVVLYVLMPRERAPEVAVVAADASVPIPTEPPAEPLAMVNGEVRMPNPAEPPELALAAVDPTAAAAPPTAPVAEVPSGRIEVPLGTITEARRDEMTAGWYELGTVRRAELEERIARYRASGETAAVERLTAELETLSTQLAAYAASQHESLERHGVEPEARDRPPVE